MRTFVIAERRAVTMTTSLSDWAMTFDLADIVVCCDGRNGEKFEERDGRAQVVL